MTSVGGKELLVIFKDWTEYFRAMSLVETS